MLHHPASKVQSSCPTVYLRCSHKHEVQSVTADYLMKRINLEETSDQQYQRLFSLKLNNVQLVAVQRKLPGLSYRSHRKNRTARADSATTRSLKYWSSTELATQALTRLLNGNLVFRHHQLKSCDAADCAHGVDNEVGDVGN
jgi:hypothetical protein